MRLGEADARSIRDITSMLGTVTVGGEPIERALAGPLTALLDLDRYLFYSLAPVDGQPTVERIVTPGTPENGLATFKSAVASASTRFGHYDPLRPERWQQNRPRLKSELERRAGSISGPLTRALRSAGLYQLDQLRVLACERNGLLGWVGGFRERPFVARDRRLLAALVPALRRRLSLERHIGEAALREAALCASMEAVPAAAYLVDQLGRILCANALGRAGLESDRAGVRDALREQLRRERRANAAGCYMLTRLDVRGIRPHYLAVKQALRADPAAMLGLARQRWSLTPRQAEVLGLLARGLSNHVIAITLHCSVRTVEIHVTALLGKVGVESRAALVARFWSELC